MTTELGGRKLCLLSRETGDLSEEDVPVFFWPMSEQLGKEIGEAAEYVRSKVNAVTRDTDRYLLAAFTVSDWNLELSPWQAEIPETGQSFGGEGSRTLSWIREAAVPYIESMFQNAELPERPAGTYPRRSYYPVGYSLAGLFSLWAAGLKDDPSLQFAGAAGCSSTMWFPGWLKYSEKKIDEKKQNDDLGLQQDIYLSLGGKEHLTSNSFIAGILDSTRAYEKLLGTDKSVRKFTLEMNKGGHFADPDGRVAKGIAWLLKAHGQQSVH